MEEYISIRVSTLRGDQKVPFQVYVKIGEKHILYIRRGDSFEGERLTKLKNKKLKKMFILSDEENHYRTYLTQNIEMAYDSKSNASIETRSAIVHGHQQSQAEEVMENPENEVGYSKTKEGIQKFVSFLSTENEGMKSILKLSNSDKSISHHCVTVSTIALALAQKNGLSQEQQTLLGLGCLLHDIDHYKSEKSNFEVPVEKMSEDDRKLYEQHPLNGARFVKDHKHFDRQVLNIILQHEEFINGSGYPSNLPENKIDPLAIYAGVANALDKNVLYGARSLAEAAKQLLINGVGKYPLQYLQALQQIAKDL